MRIKLQDHATIRLGAIRLATRISLGSKAIRGSEKVSARKAQLEAPKTPHVPCNFAPRMDNDTSPWLSLWSLLASFKGGSPMSQDQHLGIQRIKAERPHPPDLGLPLSNLLALSYHAPSSPQIVRGKQTQMTRIRMAKILTVLPGMEEGSAFGPANLAGLPALQQTSRGAGGALRWAPFKTTSKGTCQEPEWFRGKIGSFFLPKRVPSGASNLRRSPF